MRKRNSMITLLAVVVLATGCTTHRANMAKPAKKEMIGMSKVNLLACTGAPMHSAVVHGVEYLTYAEGRNCEVTFVLRNDAVVRFNTRSAPGRGLTQGEQCTFLVEKCLSE